jgi:tetratricopeptide (TPR) repeat protein
MAELWFQVLPCNSSERTRFEQDFYAHLGRLVIDYNEFLLAENPNNAEAHTKAGRAKVLFGQIQQGVNHFQAAIKANRDYDKAWYELGFVYLRQNKLEDARIAFENVVRVNPDDYEAEGSLGVIYLRNRDLNKARAHFQAALRINPDDKIASKYIELISQAKGAAENR